MHLCVRVSPCLVIKHITILDQAMPLHGIYFETFRCLRACHEFQSWSAHAFIGYIRLHMTCKGQPIQCDGHVKPSECDIHFKS